MESVKKVKMLVVIPPGWKADGTMYSIGALMTTIQSSLDAYVESYDIVSTFEEYEAIPEDKRYSYDLYAPQMGPIATKVLEHQCINNKNLKWVQALTAGVDAYCNIDVFKSSVIPLTNVKGAFSDVLGEFIALGVLYHTKHVERFMQRKAAAKWELEPVELVSNKHMLIVGYGDIGSACARIAKFGFGMTVTGLKRRPDQVSDRDREYCDQIVGND